MSVTHVDSISNYEKCLLVGGRHRFEITVDEMPALEAHVANGQAVPIRFEEVPPGVPDGSWSTIARRLSEKGATFTYWRIRPGVYRVMCRCPSP